VVFEVSSSIPLLISCVLCLGETASLSFPIVGPSPQVLADFPDMNLLVRHFFFSKLTERELFFSLRILPSFVSFKELDLDFFFVPSSISHSVNT